MSKAILVMDMPDSCIECPCRTRNREEVNICNCLYENNKLAVYNLMHERPDWCPLKPVPEKQIYYTFNDYDNASMDGWNECIDVILGE